jgi:hypothetical protein
MVTQFDDKGKIFTNIISKRPVQSVVQTEKQQIIGKIHVTPSERLKDELNGSEQFIAITDAVIYDLDGVELYRCNFLTLNRNYVIWVIPEEDLIRENSAGGIS